MELNSKISLYKFSLFYFHHKKHWSLFNERILLTNKIQNGKPCSVSTKIEIIMKIFVFGS